MPEASQEKSFNGLKWALVVILVAAATIGNIYYGAESLALRVAVLIVIGVVALLVAYNTSQGTRAWRFIADARSELRKVVWPTRQETVQTASIVILIVVVAALLLWGVDSLFALVVSNIVM